MQPLGKFMCPPGTTTSIMSQNCNLARITWDFQVKCYINHIMVTETPATESTATEFGFRTPKGDWRPPYPVKTAPVFVWPLGPRQAVKWVLSYPGFLWPWNSLSLL